MRIQNFIAKDTKELYQMIDVNVYQENLFHTKMMLKDIELDEYLFNIDANDLKPGVQKKIHKQLEKEMLEIFYGRNISK